MIKLAALALVASCSPALAECFPVADAIANMHANGYDITYGDTTGQYPLFIAEDGKGGWVVFAIVGETLCPVIGGSGGVPVMREPNT